jgi:hypothetical protein
MKKRRLKVSDCVTRATANSLGVEDKAIVEERSDTPFLFTEGRHVGRPEMRSTHFVVEYFEVRLHGRSSR